MLFIYLLTNEHLEVSGIYQITPRTISNETGIALDRINLLMAQLVKDDKILYEDSVVGIINYHRHNGLINNPKYKRAIEKSILKQEPEIQTKFCNRLGIDWVSIGNPLFPAKDKDKTKYKANTKDKDKIIQSEFGVDPLEKIKALNTAGVRSDGRTMWAQGVYLSSAEWKSLDDVYGKEIAWEAVGLAEDAFLTDQKEKTGGYVKAIAKRLKEEAINGKQTKHN